MAKPEKIIDKSNFWKAIWATVTKGKPVEARSDIEKFVMLVNKINEIIDYLDSPKEDSHEA